MLCLSVAEFYFLCKRGESCLERHLQNKKEGGLGIRSLEEFAVVFRLKQVWYLFTTHESLWVLWLDHNIFGRRNYWLMESSPRLSWNIRKMIEVKSTFKSMIRCQVRDWLKASFWYDAWTSLGPLIDLFGVLGPRELRVRREATVWEATHEGQWHLPHARSLQAEELQVCLFTLAPPNPLEVLIGFNGNSHQVRFLKNSLSKVLGCK